MTEERRVVTLLFADVTGSTALGESLDPEDLRALLARYYATAKDVIAEHGGTIEKFIGDAVMAVFGLPVAHGDDAERALAAAVELRDRVRSDPELGEQIPVRIGVNTGEVVATRDTSGGDFLVTGDAVNVTARLQQAAEPWQIMAGERTTAAAQRAFAFAPLVTLAAKGKSAGIRAAQVLGRDVAPKRIAVPLIGRTDELAELELAAGRALRDRRPALVSVIAPAGTGKTRLLEEFLDRLPTTVPHAVIAIAQCLPYGQRLTYWPLRAVLFRLIGVPEDADPADIREAIHRWLAGAELEDRERVADLLAATVGAGSEVLDRAALFAAWRSAFEVAARRAPLVILFEDLHWSSDSLLDLVEFVMQPRGDAPVLTIALTRPELLDRRPGWGGGRRNYKAIALEPMRDDEIAMLVRQLFESSPRDLVDRIVARAEGNPFYAGELVRAVMERAGSLDDPAAVERAVAALPDTVQATVLARLDGLQPDQRRILQLGSVLGRSFRAGGIVALSPDLTDRVGTAIEDLVERDLIRPSGADAFTFRHILIREVAYQTLPRSERARLHARSGEWLESVAQGRDEAYAELIAFHYREAATLPSGGKPASTAEHRRRATRWLQRAGEVAMAAAAHVEARRHFSAAIELAEPDQLPDLWERLGDATQWGREAVDAYQTANRLGREQGLGTDQQLRTLAGMLSVFMRFRGSVPHPPNPAEMASLREEAARLAAASTDEHAIARYLAADSFYPFWLGADPVARSRAGELDEAESKARRAVEIAERLGDISLQSVALDGLGSVLIVRNDAVGTREQALRRARLNDLDLVERMDAFAVAAWMSVYLGELHEALRISERGLSLAQPGQAPVQVLHVVVWRILALFFLGEWEQVLRLAGRAVALWHESGRISAGFAMRGFVAAYQVARTRRDGQTADRLREAIAAIAATYGPESITGLWPSLIAADVDPDKIVLSQASVPRLNSDALERAVGTAADLGRPPDPGLLLRPLSPTEPAVSVALVAQVHRSNALARGDVAGLDEAQREFAAIDARPFVARIRCERGLLTGNSAEMDAGLAELERIGDLEQIERYEQRAR